MRTRLARPNPGINTYEMTDDTRKHLKEQVRAACLKAARDAYDDALARGLCAEGALEAALGAIETLDLDAPDQREP
ncbi:MAG TPA: acetyltransferase [Gammaproteobacteria bacterium]